MMERLTEWKDDKKLLAKAKFRGDFGSQNILQSLAEYEDLEELIGIPLKNIAEICNNKIPEECRNPNKAIVLTDEDVDRWNEYKNAEEQGLLLRLPCAIGSTLYQPIDSRINEYKVIGLCFDIFNNKWMYEVAYEVGLEWHKTVCNFDYIGKTVFLAQEEAEQKLKEMGSDKNV